MAYPLLKPKLVPEPEQRRELVERRPAVAASAARRKREMDLSLFIILSLTVALGLLAYAAQGWSGLRAGLVNTGTMLESVWLRLLLGFAMAGFLQVVVPSELIAHWMGEESGLRGLLVGAAAGSLTPGGPYVNFPIVASLYSSGAGVGPLVAYITAWSAIPIQRTLIWEIPLMGYRFTLVRLLTSLLFPLIAGSVAPLFFELSRRFIRAVP